MATFTGSNGAEIFPDLIIGPVQAIGNDFVDAVGGDDVAIGWSGDDVIRGGAGADVIIGGLLNASGIITASGIDAADYTTSVDGVTIDLSVTVSLTLPMLGINLQLVGASQGFGGDAQGDFLVGIVNVIGSNTGADNLSGSSGANTFNGQGGNDILNGHGGNDILLGGAGDDVLVGGAGADSLQGGAGANDTADYSGSAAPVTVNLTTGAGSGGDAQGDTLTGIERLIGSPGNDNLTGSAGNDTLIGLAGDDTLLGLGGDDIIQGGLGADIMDGGGGYDTLTFANATAGVGVALNAFGAAGEAVGDTMTGFEALIGSAFGDQLAGDGGDNLVDGGDGDDYVQLSGGVDTLIGGAGRDLIDGRVVGSGFNVNLTTGTGSGGGMAVGTTLSGFELVLGSAFDDIQTANLNLGTDLVGFNGADTLNGANGDDQLFGDNYAGIVVTGGADTLNGGGGNDTLEGGAFGDVLNGGVGIDTIVYHGSAAAVTINLATGAASGGEAQGDTLIDIENVNGSDFDDVLTGSAVANRLDGGDGDDILAGLGGADALLGGSGVDLADYSASSSGVTIDLATGAGSGGDAQGDTLSGIENVVGSAHADRLTGAAGVNILTGGAGDDILAGLAGADQLIGGAGMDMADYSASGAGVTVDLGSGGGSGGDAEGDTLSSIEGAIGSGFADQLIGTGTANRLDGGDEDDALIGLGGADVLIGGGGIDTADYSASLSGVIVSLDTGVGIGGDAQGDTLTGIENVTGTDNADTLLGSAGANRLVGGTGDDFLAGLGGADTLNGGAGIDTVDYSASSAAVTIDLGLGTTGGGDAAGDTLIGIENVAGSAHADQLTGAVGVNILNGGGGDDILAGLGGADTLIGGAGNDTADYSGSAAPVTVNLTSGTGSGGDAEGDTLVSIENIVGAAHDDWLTGSTGANTLEGGAGNDLLDGHAGADTLIGGAGNDIYIVAHANDQTVELPGEGTDTVRSYINWVLTDNVDRLELFGSAANGAGNANNNTLVGNNNANVFDGGGGDDYLTAGNGNDTLHGGDGGDRLVGGAGADMLFAGAGNDFFRYEAVTDSLVGPGNRDTIMDFTHGEDKISLQALRAVIGGEAFSFIGTAAFSGVAGELRYTNYSGNVLIDADVNGDSATDMQILVAGTDFMASTDFIV